MILVDAEPQATHVEVFCESGPELKVICKIYYSSGPCDILHGTLEPTAENLAPYSEMPNDCRQRIYRLGSSFHEL